MRRADVMKVWDRIVEDALAGSAGAQKLILEYTVSKVSDLLDKDKEEGPREYVFYVIDSTAPKQGGEPKPIEGEFKSVEDANERTE